ncbi:MAG: ATP-dependent helicase, partial [Candidatus Marinimicrobia bacterium]|nr:ATP-dependent helicase [Candidatus Neomarinimicrobiota bacterium]
ESLNEISNIEDDKEINRIYKLADAVDVFPLYQQWKRENNQIDFGDMISNLWELLNKDKDVLEILQNRFEHIIIDEFQDNNFALSRIIQKIAEPQNSITVVGDDDQCIYSFRGANIQNVHNFDSTYSSHKKYQRTDLLQNYRSIPEVLKFANSIISENPERMEKGDLFSEYPSGIKPLLGIGTPEEQEHFVIDKIKELLSDGVSPGKIAVLCRTHTKCSKIAYQLLLNRISTDYHFDKLYNQKYVKDILAYFNIITDTGLSSLSLVRILQKQFSKETSAEITKQYKMYKEQNSLLDWCAKTKINIPVEVGNFVDELVHLKQISKGWNITTVFREILKFSRILRDYNHKDIQYVKNIQCIIQLQRIVEDFSIGYSHSVLDMFVRFLDVMLDVNEEILDMEQFSNTKNSVQIMTVHKAKGKEFPYVFIPYLGSGGFPLYPKTAQTSDHLPVSWRKWDAGERTDKELHYEEERRIFYVAVTRAEKGLYLTAPEKRQSVFVKKVNSEIVDKELLKMGESVSNIYEDIIAEFQNRLIIETSLEHYEIAKQIVDAISNLKSLENGIDPVWNNNPFKAEIEGKLKIGTVDSLPTKKLRLSATRIRKYDTCPLQYKFSEIDNIPGQSQKPYFQLGNVVHKVLEIFHNEGYTQKDDLYRLLDENWESGGYVFEQEEEQNRHDAKAMIDNYFDYLKNNKVDLFSSEKLFSFPLSNCDVSGKCDRIDVDDSGAIKIIDYKTSKYQKSERELKKDMQMAIYAMYAQKEKTESKNGKSLGELPEELTQLFLRHENPAVTVQFNDEELTLFRQKIEEIAHSIRKGEFDPCKGNHCQYCDYRDLVCPLYDA